ncbi:MAG: hypothetical protein LBP59_00660 [Planctomycetaceae bacterium]|jgi:hypothetical protein|nr:hypothetical protein [Planctomycetaceae bacterium]
MAEKVIFLDIDGVLQPPSSQKRFDHITAMREDAPEEFKQFRPLTDVYRELDERLGVDYRRTGEGYSPYDVAAVYFDWDKTAIAELRRILDETGAMIVISSDWRIEQPNALKRLIHFFNIYDLGEYIIDCTTVERTSKLAKTKEYENILNSRAIEILEYLKEHPEIKKWVAIDDMNLVKDLSAKHAVTTVSRLKKEDADKCIKILNS